MLPKKKCEKVPFLRLLLVASEISWRLKNVPDNFGHTYLSVILGYCGKFTNTELWQPLNGNEHVFKCLNCLVLHSSYKWEKKKLVRSWHGQTNTAMVLCISWGYLTKNSQWKWQMYVCFYYKLWSHKFTNWQKTTPLYICQQYRYEYYLTSTTLKWYMT